MLINLVEHSKTNRKILFEARAPADPESIFLRKYMYNYIKLIILFTKACL